VDSDSILSHWIHFLQLHMVDLLPVFRVLFSQLVRLPVDFCKHTIVISYIMNCYYGYNYIYHLLTLGVCYVHARYMLCG